MKRLFLFAAALTVLAACDKNNEAPPKKQTFETEIMPINGDFRHITYDSACVFRSAKDFRNFITSKDGIEMPDIDFSQNALIAVTGIAPALAENISVSMYNTGDGDILDINVHVAQSEYVKPRKWSILLKTPASIVDYIKCNINYDMPFNTLQMADSTYFSYEVIPTTHYTDSTYFVVVKKADLPLLKEYVNKDSKCIMSDTRFDIYGKGEHVSSTVMATYSLCSYNKDNEEIFVPAILKNCDYKKVIAPLGDKIIYVGLPYYRGHYAAMGEQIHFEWPLSIFVPSADIESFEKLSETLGHFEQDGIYLYKNSKLSSSQLRYLLAREGFINVASTKESCYYHSAASFDDAVKQVYE